MSRPEIPIDWKLVDELLIAGCEGVDIAPHFAIHPNTLYRRVEEKYGVSLSVYSQEKRKIGDNEILKAQYEKAVKKKDNTMLIWLGKQRLKQKERYDEVFIDPNIQKAEAIPPSKDLVNEERPNP